MLMRQGKRTNEVCAVLWLAPWAGNEYIKSCCRVSELLKKDPNDFKSHIQRNDLGDIISVTLVKKYRT